MFGRKQPEVLVVGAGPVGLCAALLLAKRGIRIKIIDKGWRTGAQSYALALHSQTLRILEKLDLLAPILKLGVSINRIKLYDGSALKASIPLREGDAAATTLLVLPQYMLESLLESALEDCGVRVEWNHELTQLKLQPNAAIATISKREKESVGYAVAHSEWVTVGSTTLTVPFVIGADGYSSFVRRSLGIEFPEVAAAKTFAVFEFQSNFDADNEMQIVVGEQTTDVLWPLPNRFLRWSFQLPSPAEDENREKDRLGVAIDVAGFPLLSEDNLRALLAERAPWFAGSIERVDWRAAVRFESRLASAFFKQRAALAGDAVHLTGPVGMQSMNIGILEANELADLIGGAIRRSDCAGTCLEAYNQRSLATWRYLHGLEDGSHCNGPTDPWLLSQKAQLLSCLPASGPDFAPMARRFGYQGH